MVWTMGRTLDVWPARLRDDEISGMDLKDFKESLDRNTPPEDLGRALQALWHQAKGEWDTSAIEPNFGARRLASS